MLPEDYLAIRRLERPDGVGTNISVQRPGISNAGDVFAVYGEENDERGVRWPRSSQYVPEEIGRAPDTEGGGMHSRIQPCWVMSEGIVTGRSAVLLPNEKDDPKTPECEGCDHFGVVRPAITTCQLTLDVMR